MAAALTQAEAARRKNVSDAIDRVLFKINELEAIVSEFDGNNDLLHAKLNEYIADLGNLEAAKDDMIAQGQPVEVAVELLRAIDEGTNPDTFTVQLFRDSLAANQASKGKVEAFKALREQTAAQLAAAFPQTVADYRQLRAAPEAAAARAAAAPEAAAVGAAAAPEAAAAGAAMAAAAPAAGAAGAAAQPGGS